MFNNNIFTFMFMHSHPSLLKNSVSFCLSHFVCRSVWLCLSLVYAHVLLGGGGGGGGSVLLSSRNIRTDLQNTKFFLKASFFFSAVCTSFSSFSLGGLNL